MSFMILTERKLPANMAFDHSSGHFDLMTCPDRGSWEDQIRGLLAKSARFASLEVQEGPTLVEEVTLVEVDHNGKPRGYAECKKRPTKGIHSLWDLPIDRDLWLVLVSQEITTVTYHRDRDGEDMPTYRKDPKNSWGVFLCEDKDHWLQAMVELKQNEEYKSIRPIIARAFKFALKTNVRIA